MDVHHGASAVCWNELRRWTLEPWMCQAADYGGSRSAERRCPGPSEASWAPQAGEVQGRDPETRSRNCWGPCHEVTTSRSRNTTSYALTRGGVAERTLPKWERKKTCPQNVERDGVPQRRLCSSPRCLDCYENRRVLALESMLNTEWHSWRTPEMVP